MKRLTATLAIVIGLLIGWFRDRLSVRGDHAIADGGSGHGIPRQRHHVDRQRQ